MLRVCHLYPDLLDLYGDRGNIIAFKQRCQWRGIPVSVQEISLRDKVDFSKQDFVFLGGGSDREQGLVAADLLERRDELSQAIENGLVLLAICGGYQLLGQYYFTGAGEKIPGLGLMDFHTGFTDKRLMGNVVVEVDIGAERLKVAGFENHSGCTYLGGCQPFGHVLSGNGNNGKDRLEGARYKNVFCTYLHGPLLPKNARLTDYLLRLALTGQSGDEVVLPPLEHDIEDRACLAILGRLGFSGITN